VIVLSCLAGLIAAVLLLPTLSDLISVVTVATRRVTPRRGSSEALPRLLFLVPAHDEEALIASCLESLRSMRYPEDRLARWVVADNCSDQTARIARAAGATCLERHVPTLPGKPHAIAWAMERLPLQDFDAVVIVDADIVVDPQFARGLARAHPMRGKVVQPQNNVRNPGDNALTRMAAVLSAANHHLAFGLKNRAELNVPLSAGMTVGTDVLARHKWPAFSIGEDWELYAILTEQGVRTESAPEAHLFAEEARSLEQSATQRHRWAAGKLTVLARYAPKLVASRQIAWRQKLDALAELSSLGPAVHLGLVGVLVTALLLARAPLAVSLVGALGLSLARMALYAAVAVSQERHPWKTALAFSYLPFYTLWRLGVQLTALTMLGDKPWIRTQRNR